MKYSLRSLMIVVTLGPPLLAGGFFLWRERQPQKLALTLVTVIVALAVGWWVDHRRQAMKEQRLVKLQKEADAKLRMLGDSVLILVTPLKPARRGAPSSQYLSSWGLSNPAPVAENKTGKRPPTNQTSTMSFSIIVTVILFGIDYAMRLRNCS